MTSTAAKALKAEATETEIKVEFRGDEYVLPKNVEEWPLDVMEAMEDEKPVSALRSLLGPAQWAKVKSHGLKMADLEEVTDTFLNAVGLTSGKSES